MSFEAFSKLAEEYVKWYERKREIYEKELECVKKAVRGKSLEIGGGTGAFSFPLGALNLDPALGALKVAKRKRVECVRGIAEMLPFRSKAFETAYLVTSLCFIGDPEGALKEAERVASSVVACIIPKESELAKEYEERGRKGHKIYKHANFLSSKRFDGWEEFCNLGWFSCYRKISP